MTIESDIATQLLGDEKIDRVTKEKIRNKHDRSKLKYALCIIRNGFERFYPAAYDYLRELYESKKDDAKFGYLLYMAIAQMKMKNYDLALEHCRSAIKYGQFDDKMFSLSMFIRKKQKKTSYPCLFALGGVSLISFLLPFLSIKYFKRLNL